MPTLSIFFLVVAIFTSTLLVGFPIDLPNITLFLDLALFLAMLPFFSAPHHNSVLRLILYDFFNCNTKIQQKF